MLKHHPCAYCGTSHIKRTKGHVFPKSIYPDYLPIAKRITVPECEDCKAIWEDAEPQFRNILLSIWNPIALPSDSRTQSMWRSFREKDGRRRARKIFDLLKTEQFGDETIQTLSPAEDPDFNLILRRIVRGLVHHHKLGTAIPDSRVACGVMRWAAPPAFDTELIHNTIANNFVSYAYSPAEESIHSFWLIEFSNHIRFFGIVDSKSSRTDLANQTDFPRL